MKIKLSDNEDNKNLELIEYSNELEDRIDKAIEYLESYNTDFKNCRFGEAPISMRELGDLLDILKGVNKPRKSEEISLEELESCLPQNTIEEEYDDWFWS